MRSIKATAYHPQSKKLQFEVFDAGNLVGTEVVDPRDGRAVERKLTKSLRVPLDVVLQASANLGKEIEIPDGVALPGGPILVRLRAKRQSESEAVTFPLDDAGFATIAQATELDVDGETWKIPPDCLITWDDPRFGYLDIDVPKGCPIHPNEASRIANLVRPRPRWWHQSHSGGLHLYYLASDGFEALDLAAVAAVWVRQYEPRYKCELKQVTRHPAQTGYPFHEQTQSPDVDHVRSWLMCDTEDRATSEIVEDLGYEPGRRYTHERCPIDPRPTSKRDEPVIAGDRGVFCHVCSAKNVSLNRYKAGFVPYSYWTGGGLRSTIQDCVRCFTHWSHAWIVLNQQLNVPESLAKRCYRVMLKLWHEPNDPRIDPVFYVGKDLIRRQGYWQYVDGASLKVGHGKRELSALPAVQNEKGEAIGSLVDRFCQSCDLSSHGYRAVEMIHGIRLWGHHLPYADGRIAAVRYGGRSDHKPRYIEPDQRLSLAECRGVYNNAFKGIPWEYLLLLIAARGVAEGGEGMPPFLYCWGASGAGKTQTIHIAASTVGDCNTEVNWSHDTQRFRQGVQEAVARGTFCAINEVKKSAQRVRMDIDLALEPLLTLTEHSVSHQLYVGPVALGRVPVVVMTETTAPVQLLRSEQLTRRLVNIHLPHRLSWDANVGANTQRVRELGDEMRHAADSLVSHVIDDYFSEPLTIFQIADRLGFQRMEDFARDETGIRDILRDFFKAVCAAPDAPEQDQKRNRGSGWKRCDLSKGVSEDESLDGLYLQLADIREYTTSTRILETDWTRLLGLDPADGAVECQIRAKSERHKNTVWVRFRRGDKINGEILQ